MSLPPPTGADLRRFAEELGLRLSPEAISQYQSLLTYSLSAYETVQETAARVTSDPATPFPRYGERVADDSDPHNAWITRCAIDGSADGPLAGVDVAVKDNVAVAGIEMTCGSRVLEGYEPARDATVVSRILEAGGRIVGKTNMDDMAFAGTGHSSAFGPTRNPRDDERLSGGSSGGSAIVVATGEANAAIGTDQAGSIRAPASWTGVVGHKPTYGLVPYTGAVGIDPTIDHCGPLADSVDAAAALLSVLAGPDPDDPRQPSSVPAERYEAALTGRASDLSVAVVEEGFGRSHSERVVDDAVRDALAALEDAGARVESRSVPLHADAQDIFTVSVAEGFLATVRGNGESHNRGGRYHPDLQEAFGRATPAFPPTVVMTLLLGAYAGERFHSRFYGKAMNLRRELRRAYDELLAEFDVVAMPTTPQRAITVEDHDTIADELRTAWSNLLNTCVFNMTGHPSLSIPLEPDGGLPCGLMLTGSQFADGTVLDAGSTVENIC